MGAPAGLAIVPHLLYVATIDYVVATFDHTRAAGKAKTIGFSILLYLSREGVIKERTGRLRGQGEGCGHMAPYRSEPNRARAVFVDQGLVVRLERLDVRMLVRFGVPESVTAIVS